MPRAGARAGGGKGWVVRRQFPSPGVEAKHENPIEPQIGYRDEPAARIEYGVVRMRTRLPFPIGARFARQVQQIGARPQASVLLDRHHANRAGAVIRGHDPAAGRVDRQVHRVLAAAGLPIERRNVPVLLVDRIGADLVEVGMHRIEKALRAVERQKGGVDDFEELLLGPDARCRVNPVDADTAAMPFALRCREGADIGEQPSAVGAGLRFGMPAAQNRRPRHSESGTGL